MKIDFNKKFYNPKFIKEAAEAYKKLADFRIEIKRESIKVILKNIDPDCRKLIKGEFCNYVLGLMKNDQG